MSLRVSIVIPTYNHAHFLGRALQSVLNQTYTNWEVLVVDNHSEDNTVEVINKFNDPRIQHFLIHNDGVIAASRNLGILKSTGEWIAFLDSDDYWYPEKLVTIIQDIKIEDQYDVFSTDELMVDSNTGAKKILRYGPFEKNFYKTMLIEGNRLSPSATIVRRDFLVKNKLLFNESKDYITVEDYDLWLNLARLDARFKFIHSIQGEYVIHATNNSAQLSRHKKNFETLLHDHVFKIQRFASPDNLWKKISLKLHITEVREKLANRQFGDAIKKLMQISGNNPGNMIFFLFSKLKFHLRRKLV